MTNNSPRSYPRFVAEQGGDPEQPPISCTSIQTLGPRLVSCLAFPLTAKRLNFRAAHTPPCWSHCRSALAAGCPIPGSLSFLSTSNSGDEMQKKIPMAPGPVPGGTQDYKSLTHVFRQGMNFSLDVGSNEECLFFQLRLARK